jgi:hypothetical protein
MARGTDPIGQPSFCSIKRWRAESWTLIYIMSGYGTADAGAQGTTIARQRLKLNLLGDV